MQKLKFLKWKKPTWDVRAGLAKIFRSSLSFSGAWRKFVGQFPSEVRSSVKTYQHFIVLGREHSGKTALIHDLIEPGQDLYPFDTVCKAHPDIQFYLGSQQVIQELSFTALESRAIKTRKQLIRIWKKLYARRDPLVVIAYDISTQEDPKELGRFGQLLAGKISLLAEIRQVPIKVRIALTHLDTINGYLALAKFLKQQNIDFHLHVSSDFESNVLVEQIKRFSEDYHSLILTTVSDQEYVLIATFFKQLSELCPAIEEFLRALISRIPSREQVQLESLFLTSNAFSGTSYPLFHWTRLPSRALFFRYPLLKHQLASAASFCIIAALLCGTYVQNRNEFLQLQKGIELLDLFQYSTFDEECLPQLEMAIYKHAKGFWPLRPLFFQKKLSAAKNRLSQRIWKHTIDPAFRKAILDFQGEFKTLYFLGLSRTALDENLKKFIVKNAAHWGKVTGIDERLIRIYTLSSMDSPVIPEEALAQLTSSLPLTNCAPWATFFQQFHEVMEQPLIADHHFHEIMSEVSKFLVAIGRMKNDPMVLSVAALLEESGLLDNESIQTVQWMGEHLDSLTSFFTFLQHSFTPPLDVKGMGLSQFFVKIKELSRMAIPSTDIYRFSLQNRLFAFDPNLWAKLIVVYNVEQAIDSYMALHTLAPEGIFFHEAFGEEEIAMNPSDGSFRLFNTHMTVPTKYSRGDYEKRVRSTAEKFANLIESLPIHEEGKKRFINFLAKGSISYIKSYQEKYFRFFESYDVQNRSMEDLKKLLQNLTQPTSSFYDFLRNIQYQTNVFSEPILSLSNMDEFNEFGFLNTILAQKDGVMPIAEYQNILETLLLDLDTLSDSANSSNFPYLAPYLSPAARISLNISHHSTASFLVRTTEALQKIGVPEKFQGVFTKPLDRLHLLGLKELQATVESVWAQEIQPQTLALLSKFPFNPTSEQRAPLEEIEAVLHPKSPLFLTLQQAIEASNYLPEETNNAMRQQMYRSLQISKTLWDEEGNPKPFVARIKALPFSGALSEELCPVLSYLLLGNQSLYHLNQAPSWETLAIEWWKEDISSLGLELFNRLTRSKVYLTRQTAPVTWSFFTLLQQGTQEADGVWSWNLSDTKGAEVGRVSFCFENNPLTLLSGGPSL